MAHRTRALLLIIGGLLAGGPALAGDAMPWDERVLRDPLDLDTVAAGGDGALDALIERGAALFSGKFTSLDGAGRPRATQAIVPTLRKRPVEVSFARTHGPDAGACSSCHNEPVAGGAGDFVANVFVSEGFESADFDTTDPQFSNERNTNHLFGAGLVELLAREMTADLQAIRREALRSARETGAEANLPLESKGVSFGRIVASPDGMVDVTRLDGVDTDLVVRPFSQKGVFASLRQFTVNAMNHHHGIQPIERFGARWTGTDDHDGDGVVDEMTPGDVSAVVAWQATLEPPTRLSDLPPVWSAAAGRGEALFGDVGCAGCHRPALPLDSLVFTDPGPVDGAGTLKRSDVRQPIAIDFARFPWIQRLPRDEQGRVLVPLYGDLKRHRIADGRNPRLGNELFAQRFVDRDVFMTAELWGIASTAPYGHRGDITTLDEMIRAHGGAAADVTKAYVALPETDRQAIVAFLKTLVVGVE